MEALRGPMARRPEFQADSRRQGLLITLRLCEYVQEELM